jgi:serine/threonine-protein kinase
LLPPGERIAGRYELKGLIGIGGMGAVYEARHLELGKPVAIKVLIPALAKDSQIAERFLREGRAAAAVDHPNIVEVFDLGTEPSGLTFIAMEKLEGEDLRSRIARAHPLDPRFVARLGAELTGAVDAAHRQGVIHRDLKPANVFLSTRGPNVDVVKVLDFGIARLAGAAEAQALTATGQVLGTPAYMAPEQIRGERNSDARVDIYGIGAVLYEALTGVPPFRADSLGELALKVADDDPEPLAALRPGLPRRMVELVERAMRKNPAERPHRAAELETELRALLADREPEVLWAPAPALTRPGRRGDGLDVTFPSGARRTRRRAALGVALAMLSLLAAATLWFSRPAPAPSGGAPLSEKTTQRSSRGLFGEEASAPTLPPPVPADLKANAPPAAPVPAEPAAPAPAKKKAAALPPLLER